MVPHLYALWGDTRESLAHICRTIYPDILHVLTPRSGMILLGPSAAMISPGMNTKTEKHWRELTGASITRTEIRFGNGGALQEHIVVGITAYLYRASNLYTDTRARIT